MNIIRGWDCKQCGFNNHSFSTSCEKCFSLKSGMERKRKFEEEKVETVSEDVVDSTLEENDVDQTQQVPEEYEEGEEEEEEYEEDVEFEDIDQIILDQVQFLQPKRKMKLIIHQTEIEVVQDENSSQTISNSSIESFIFLPHPKTSHRLLILLTDPLLVIKFPIDPLLRAAMTRHSLAEQANELLELHPDEFASVLEERIGCNMHIVKDIRMRKGIPCALDKNMGTLFVLNSLLVFIETPVLVIHFKDIQSISSTLSQGSSNRYFSIEVKDKASNIHHFGMVEQTSSRLLRGVLQKFQATESS